MAKIKKIYTLTLKLILKNIITLLIGQSFIFLLSLFLLVPMVTQIYHITLRFSGYSYVTVKNIGRFLLHPVPMLMAVVLIIIIGVFLLLEIIFLTSFFDIIEQRMKPKLIHVFKITSYRFLVTIYKGNIKLIPSVWVMMGLCNLPVLFYCITRIRFIKFFIEEIPVRIIVLLLIVVAVAIIVLFFRSRLFFFHYLILENENFLGAKEESKEISGNRKGSTLLYFVCWNLILAFIILMIYIFVMGITILFVAGISDKSLAVATFISLNDTLVKYFIGIIYILSTIWNVALFTYLFHRYRLTKPKENKTYEEYFKNTYPLKKTLRILLIVLAAANFYLFFYVIRNGSPLDYMNLDSIKITSHRGFSKEVPENTLPAVEKALEEQADFVEVDVRVTKDGELVLLHDKNLKRTTGVNKNIWDTDYDQIQSLDAGSWMDESFAGTKIPTLKEVFELCKGQVFLNLDLKYYKDSEKLAAKVAALIEEYDMVWQCVITSTSLTCLEEIKEINPEIRTGYITYQIYPALFKNKDIDFFSVKSNLVSKSVVSEIHKNGKEVHVWTVDSKQELERVKRIGVDNIITDNPAYAKTVLFEEESDQLFITLLKIIME